MEPCSETLQYCVPRLTMIIVCVSTQRGRVLSGHGHGKINVVMFDTLNYIFKQFKPHSFVIFSCKVCFVSVGVNSLLKVRDRYIEMRLYTCK